MKKFIRTWKKSKKSGKQRKYRANALLHIKKKFVNIHLSKLLREKYQKRSIQAKKGDKIKILRGQFRKKEGKIERVSIKHSKVYVTGIETLKRDGSKSLYALQPSNLMIIELNLDDKKRKKIVEKKNKGEVKNG